MTLTGAAALDGGATSGAGTLAAQGTTTASAFYLTGSTMLSNTGLMTLSSYLYVGYYGTDTAQLVNKAAGTLQLLNNATLYGAVGGLFTNAGTLDKAAGAGTPRSTSPLPAPARSMSPPARWSFKAQATALPARSRGAGGIAFNAGSDVLSAGLALSAGRGASSAAPQ